MRPLPIVQDVPAHSRGRTLVHLEVGEASRERLPGPTVGMAITLVGARGGITERHPAHDLREIVRPADLGGPVLPVRGIAPVVEGNEVAMLVLDPVQRPHDRHAAGRPDRSDPAVAGLAVMPGESGAIRDHEARRCAMGDTVAAHMLEAVQLGEVERAVTAIAAGLVPQGLAVQAEAVG